MGFSCLVPGASSLESTAFLLLLQFIDPLNYLFSNRFSSRNDREKYDPKLFFIKV
jgi:hypothetical protein